MAFKSLSDIFPNIPRYTYFKAKTIYTGSKANLNFRFEPFDEIKLYIWHGKICYDKAKELGKIDEEKTFEQSEQGFLDSVKYLENYWEHDENRGTPAWESYNGWDEDYSFKFQTELSRRREKEDC